MKRLMPNKLLFIGTLGLFLLNFTPVMALVMQIEVHGGGLRLEGPCLLEFPAVNVSFAGQTTDLNTRNIAGECNFGTLTQPNPNSLKITDENGGQPFSVMISSSDFTSNTGPSNNISSSKFFVQNKDSDDSTNDIDTVNGSPNDVNLSEDTNSFTTLDTQRTLLNGTGGAPGIWKIYPLFKINIPAALPPGLYSSTVTFDVF